MAIGIQNLTNGHFFVFFLEDPNLLTINSREIFLLLLKLSYGRL